MKRKKTLLVLCIVLAAIIAAIIIEGAVKRHIDTINTIDEEIFALDTDDLTEIAIEYDGESITLEKSDGVWTYSGDSDFPVDQDYVAELLSYFESVHASFIIDDVEDYSQYGLSSPEATVTFTGAGEDTITFGTFSTIDEKRYICLNSGSVYLIDEDLLEYVSADVEDYLDRDEVYDYSQLLSLEVTGGAAVNVEYDPDGSYTYTDDYDYYYIDGSEHRPLSETLVLNFVNSLSSMDLSDYETYKATDDDLKSYGFDSPDLTVVITGEVPTEEEGDAVEEKTLELNFVATDDGAYVNFADSPIVYVISSDDYEAISEVSYETLRPKEIVSIDWTNVASMTVESDGETYIVSVEYDKNDGNTYTIDGETLDFVTVTSKIDGLTLSEVGSDYEKGTGELSFAITLNDDDATTINVALYQYDGDYCVCDVDGQTVGLVSRSSMSTLREEITSSILNKGKESSDEDGDSEEEEDYSYDLGF